MITGITIQNFKGIGDEIKLELRPITLLFGANSAGKSSILHALHYAREVFERHNLDADETIAGGKYIDLGGFEHFIHRNGKRVIADSNKTIRLKINLELTENDLPSFGADYDTLNGLLTADFDSLLNPINSASVELFISWSAVEHCPYISSTIIYYNDIEFARIIANANLSGVAVKFTRLVPDSEDPDWINEESTLDHPCLKKFKDTEEFGTRTQGLIPFEDVDGIFEDEFKKQEEFNFENDNEVLLHSALEYCGYIFSPEGNMIELSGKGDALPDLDEPLEYEAEPDFQIVTSKGEDYSTSPNKFADELVLALSELIIGPCQLVRDQLKQFRYLGPLRDTPPRNFQPPRYPDPSRWSSGLGAWDALQNGSLELVDSVGEWLGDPENLGAGCHIERRSYFEMDLADPTVRKLINRRAFDELDEDESVDLSSKSTLSRIVLVPNGSDLELRPHDVGVGISQVLPVIVMALDGNDRLLAIEQPELHIHPRLQAELADLFVESVHKNQHRFIIETHSEHLILRLLRRIRETEKGEAPTDRQLRTNDLAVYYLKQEDGSSSEQRIDVDVNGEFIQPWPDDFFDIDFKERFL